MCRDHLRLIKPTLLCESSLNITAVWHVWWVSRQTIKANTLFRQQCQGTRDKIHCHFALHYHKTASRFPSRLSYSVLRLALLVRQEGSLVSSPSVAFLCLASVAPSRAVRNCMLRRGLHTSYCRFACNSEPLFSFLAELFPVFCHEKIFVLKKIITKYSLPSLLQVPMEKEARKKIPFNS